VVVNFWLRAGNTATINNALGFVAELLSRLPHQIRLRLVRADSGFSGTCVAQMSYQEQGWPKPRRLILIRHEVQEKRRVSGKRLIDCPGYLFQGLVTGLAERVSPLEVWRRYNGRAGIEHVIRELRHGYGLQQFYCQDFWATEAVLSMVVMAYNLVVLFERFLGWMDRYAVQTLRFHLFTTAGIISQTGGLTTIKLAAPPGRRFWWWRLWERIASPFPNCNAVEPLFP